MPKQKSISIYIKITLSLFFISAFYGWLIRFNSVTALPFFSYTKFLQAHPHVTFLGWGFMSLTTLFNWIFLPHSTSFSKTYKWLFGLEFTCIFLMLISFSIQEYKLFSIVFLSVFLLTSYVYVVQFYKDFNRTKQDKTIVQFVNVSLFFYILSSIGIWLIGVTVATQGKTDLYFNSIYFYLHFLYNGFFVFALFGLFFYHFSKKNVSLSNKELNLFFWLTFGSCFPAYLLSLVKYENTIITAISFIAATLQIIAFYYLVILLKNIKIKGIVQFMFISIIIAFGLKTMLQFGSALPMFRETIIGLKSYFVIGYIHLITLGFVSSSILYLFLEFNLLKLKNRRTKMGLFSFFIVFSQLKPFYLRKEL